MEVVTCQVDQARVSHLDATALFLSCALGGGAGPCSLAQMRAGVPGPRSPVGHEEVADRCWVAVEAKALVQLPCRHVGPLCSYTKDEIRTFPCV